MPTNKTRDTKTTIKIITIERTIKGKNRKNNKSWRGQDL
jgi:hypothetical protein